MSHISASKDLQGHGSHQQDPIDSHQELIEQFQKRLADPNSAVNYQMILEVLAQAVTNCAQDLETALVTAEDGPEATKNEHIASVFHSLHNRLDFVQDFLDAMPLPSQIQTNLEARQVQQLQSDTISARKVRVKSTFACGMLLVLIFSIIIGSQWEYCG